MTNRSVRTAAPPSSGMLSPPSPPPTHRSFAVRLRQAASNPLGGHADGRGEPKSVSSGEMAKTEHFGRTNSAILPPSQTSIRLPQTQRPAYAVFPLSPVYADDAEWAAATPGDKRRAGSAAASERKRPRAADAPKLVLSTNSSAERALFSQPRNRTLSAPYPTPDRPTSHRQLPHPSKSLSQPMQTSPSKLDILSSLCTTVLSQSRHPNLLLSSLQLPPNPYLEQYGLSRPRDRFKTDSFVFLGDNQNHSSSAAAAAAAAKALADATAQAIASASSQSRERHASASSASIDAQKQHIPLLH